MIFIAPPTVDYKDLMGVPVTTDIAEIIVKTEYVKDLSTRTVLSVFGTLTCVGSVCDSIKRFIMVPGFGNRVTNAIVIGIQGVATYVVGTESIDLCMDAKTKKDVMLQAVREYGYLDQRRQFVYVNIWMDKSGLKLFNKILKKSGIDTLTWKTQP